MKCWRVGLRSESKSVQYVMADDPIEARRLAVAADLSGHDWESDGKIGTSFCQEVTRDGIGGTPCVVADGKSAVYREGRGLDEHLAELERQANTPGYRAYQERAEAEGQTRLCE